MMVNIRIGLKIICVSGSIYLTKGRSYEIVEYDTFAEAIRVYGDDGRARWYEYEKFDCVTLRRDEIIDNILL